LKSYGDKLGAPEVIEIKRETKKLPQRKLLMARGCSEGTGKEGRAEVLPSTSRNG